MADDGDRSLADGPPSPLSEDSLPQPSERQCHAAMARPTALLALLLALAAVRSSGALTCGAGTYDYYSETCKACSTNCKTCGWWGEDCTSCYDGRYFLPGDPSGACVETCPTGTYPDAALRKCQTCRLGCTTCTIDGTTCTVCNAGFYLNEVPGTCGDATSCPPGTFADTGSGTCAACATDCRACTSADAGACTFCVDGTFLDTSAGTCGTTCPDGTFGEAGSNLCQACDPTCATCSLSASNCASCSGSFLSTTQVESVTIGVCVGTCPDGKYGDTTSFTCQDCDCSCSTCSAAGSGGCTACPEGKILASLLDTTSPPSACVDTPLCPTGCTTCTIDGTTCTACGTGYWKDGGACVTKCSPGTFKSPPTWASGAVCALCTAPCATCSRATKCLSCTGALYLDKKTKTCAASCPAATYDAGGNVCRPCNPQCTACTGELWSDCTACAATFYLSGTTCGAACPAGKYPDAATRSCPTCPAGCKTCTDANTCTSCEGGYWKTADSKCVLPANCPAGTFAHTNPANRICAACTSSCATCSAWGPNSCVTCAAPNFLSGSTCVATCPAGKYGDATTRACVACTTGFWATATGCVDTCPAGTYKSPSTWAANARCAPCVTPCQSCTNPAYCLSCKNGGTPTNGACPTSRRSLLAWAATA
ncbi:hypothetical protein Rsub_13112 [Raphidocelis subcapitata]|uniref:EGF-like domain-containing protein n=1 Tax=Raphidocelis subcapitata TaxID=307507 RepID=A0A2V0PPK7_9CHLO|nr:hypothetical protein Rsub_13112 [Raphidocelis subcapitata]|eukprot:GBF99980.1 hypothetical protein Rsub_13112 [Raphidocelis subcapitata]